MLHLKKRGSLETIGTSQISFNHHESAFRKSKKNYLNKLEDIYIPISEEPLHKQFKPIENELSFSNSNKKNNTDLLNNNSNALKCKKRPWTEAEDQLVVKLVEEHGPQKWSFIANHLPGRIGKQCRERWHNHLNPVIKKSTWSIEEEWILYLQHKLYGNQWAIISKNIKGRTDNNIKNHWNSNMKRKIPEFQQKLFLLKNKVNEEGTKFLDKINPIEKELLLKYVEMGDLLKENDEIVQVNYQARGRKPKKLGKLKIKQEETKENVNPDIKIKKEDMEINYYEKEFCNNRFNFTSPNTKKIRKCEDYLIKIESPNQNFYQFSSKTLKENNTKKSSMKNEKNSSNNSPEFKYKFDSPSKLFNLLIF